MEVLQEGLNVIQKVLYALAAGTVALGGYTFFDGYKSDNSPDKAKGIKEMISGGGIFLIAQVLLPLIKL
jgi:hypothetical protein